MAEHTAPLRILSIAHTAVSRAAGRLRYHPLADDPTLDTHLVVPARWFQFGRWYVADHADDPGVTLHPLPVRLPKAGPATWYLHHYPGLAKLAASLDPHVIHLWEEPWGVVALQAAWLARRSGAALVMEVDQNILKRLPAPFEHIRRHVLRHTDLVLSRSDEATEVVRASGYTGPAATIGYGVDQTVFFPGPSRGSPAPLRLCYVGRLVEEKGLDDVLAALTIAPADVRLSILGEGPHLPALQAHVERAGLRDRVAFHPWTDPAGVGSFMRERHALVLPTRHTERVKEQFGRVIIEAQACGIPVIGAATGAIPHVVGPGGWIVPERDPAALAALFARLDANPAEIDAKGAAALANVVARFTYAAVAKDLVGGWRQGIACKAARHGQGHCRIVQAVQEFSQSGGTEKVAFELQRVWQANGTDSTVLAATVGNEVAVNDRQRLRFVLQGVAQRIPTRGRWRHIGRSALVPAYTLAASSALRRGRRPNNWAENAVVLSHGDSFVADVIVLHAVNAASLAQKRTDREWRWALNPLHLWVAARDRLMLRGLRAKRYVAVSHRVVSELERFHGIPRSRIAVIPNGTDIGRFTPDGPSAGLRQEFGIAADAALLLFVGHEFDRKGLAHLIAALRHPGCATAHVVAVGAGDHARYGAMAESFGVRRRVHFAGPRQNLPEIYRDADAFVFPTSYETFSLVCMEAMASGVPVFATRVGGIEDYLTDGVNGFAIDRDPAAIAAIVGATLADKPLLDRLRAGARTTSLRFGWDTVAGSYHELLLQVWREKIACKL